ncbi:hypothetical protein BZA70DRAFT_285386 [Myxozyma melibiosi]|uniref:Transcription factor SipA3 n=1 Tax=Myxozyma melibiosi TaxID=54550 RepID=A0ABR1EY81_9ASCO
MNADSDPFRVRLIPVSLKEAALDSPSFRTASWHISEQVEAVERWIDQYVKAGHRLSIDADNMQESVNMLLGRSFPTFITENIIDHDYTLTAMKSYSEGLRIFWANFIKIIKGMEKNVIEQLDGLHRKELRQYKDIKRNFDIAQQRYDSLVAKYNSQARTKEPSSLREDAFQLYEARKLYVKVSFDLCLITVALKHGLDRVIISSFSDQWLIMGHDTNEGTDAAYGKVGDDLRRIRKWSDLMESSMKILFKELNITRRDLESLIMNEISPPRDLAEYSNWTVPNLSDRSHKSAQQQQHSGSLPASPVISSPTQPQTVTSTTQHASVIDPQSINSEKHGWLFLRTYVGKPARQAWVRRWVFVKDGIFGWLVQSPSKSYVEESDKVGVLLCNVKPSTAEDRRFCFEVTTKDTSLMLQAESQSDLVAWLNIFDAAKRKALDSPNNNDTDKAFEIISPFPEFASTVQTSADAELTHDRHEGIPSLNRTSQDFSRQPSSKRSNPPTPALQALINAGQAITGQHTAIQNFITGADRLFDEIVPPSTDLAPTTLANNPIATSMTKTAIVAHASVPPFSFPNSLTANTWGSVNWGVRQLAEEQEEERKHLQDAANGDSSHVPVVVIEPPPSEDGNSAANERELYQNRTYQSYIPYELRVQDAQLRTIFPNVGLDENVVLVFRTVWSGSTMQVFSGRAYVTQKRIYLYANNGDMVTARFRSLGDIASVRGESNQFYDAFFVDFKDGSEMSTKTYLDSGRIIQRRMSFLIENYNSAKPLGVEEILKHLLELDNQTTDVNWDEVPSPLAEDENADPMDNTAVVKATANLALDRRLLSPARQLPDRSVKPKLRLPEKAIEYDLSNTMDKLIFQRKFELSAKALFHLMFGDMSTLFVQFFVSSGAIDIKQSPWINLGGTNLDREIKFEVERTVIRGYSKRQSIVCSQKVEKMDDYLLYVVSDRRTPWNLPMAELFSQTTQFVISYVSKSSCQLSIWGAVEYNTLSSLVKTIAHRAAISDLEQDAKVINMLVTKNVRQLGTKGRTSKSIQLYGQVGKSSKPVDVSKESKIMQLQNKQQMILFFSRRTSGFLLLEELFLWLEKAVALLLTILLRSGQQLLGLITEHWFLVVVAVSSLLLNLFLGTRSTVSYFTEKRAFDTMSQIGVKPNGILAKAVYLKDLQDYLVAGKELAKEPDGVCYSKFRELSEILTPESPIELSNAVYTDSVTQDAARRIWLARQKAGIERHQHVVAIRVISRVEKELVRAEWGNWLHAQRLKCEDVLASREGGVAQREDLISSLVGVAADYASNATEWERVVREYCASCENEFENEHCGFDI